VPPGPAAPARCSLPGEGEALYIWNLENPNPHRGQVYPLYGPVEFTYAEIAQVLRRVLKKQVQYKRVSIDTMLQLMVSGGQKPPAGHNARTLYGAFESTSEPRGESFVIQHLREVAIDIRTVSSPGRMI
jgi:hypothetical protein